MLPTDMLKDLKREKPWAKLRMSRRTDETARPWAKAGMTRQKWEEMILLPPAAIAAKNASSGLNKAPR